MKFLMSLLVYAFVSTPFLYSQPEMTAGEFRDHIRFLSSDSLAGRKSGEDGNRAASKYIAEEFARLGLVPAGDSGTYFQQFDFLSKVLVEPQTSLQFNTKSGTLNIAPGRDFLPFAFSSDTLINAPVVFAGYGISDSSLNYDDYAGLDVEGKLVVILRYSPDIQSPHGDLSRHEPLRAKVFLAREKGAAGIICLMDEIPDRENGRRALSLESGLSNSGIAGAAMRFDLFDSLFGISSIKSLIDSTKTPRSATLEGVIAGLNIRLSPVYSRTANVLGVLPGNDPKFKDEYTVIGAHFDHLGMGGSGSGSLAPDTTAIHRGADDNASGSSAVLELAEWISSKRSSLRRNILFAGFSGEELGILGSSHFTQHPPFPLDRIITMLNLDMVGRMKESLLVLEGTGTAQEWDSLVARTGSRYSLTLKTKPDGFGPSDHSAFYARDIPVLFFFTNLHEDYHKPSDTWEKINCEGLEQVAGFVGDIAMAIDTMALRPTFQKVQSSPIAGAGTQRGIRVTLGIVPDYAEAPEGVKISGTRPGSPAEKAGLLGGDIIIRFGGKEIKNLYDLTYLLGERRPGDVVLVALKRGSEELEVEATLVERK